MNLKNFNYLRDVLMAQTRIHCGDSWKDVIDSACIGVSVVMRDGTYMYVNDAYSRALGYTEEKELAPGFFVPELFFENIKKTTHDIPEHHQIKALEAGFRFSSTRQGQGDYNAFKKQWKGKTGEIVTGICRTSVNEIKGMPAMFSWISFKKRDNFYENLADEKHRSVFEMEEEISFLHNRIEQLKIRCREKKDSTHSVVGHEGQAAGTDYEI